MVMEPNKKVKPHKLYQADLIEDFETKTIAEQYNIVFGMPTEL